MTPYFTRFASDPNYGLHLMRPLDYSCYAGSSVFVSTPSDLVRFGMAINSGKLLQPATVELLQTSQRLASGEETGYGLGWDLKTVTLAGKQTRVIGHDGDSLGGMVASLMTFPEYGIVVAVTSNISYSPFQRARHVAERCRRSRSHPDRRPLQLLDREASQQLDDLNESELAAYRLPIVPGGNFEEIGNGLDCKHDRRPSHCHRRTG